MGNDESQFYWTRAAKRLSRSLRFGWWLQFLATPLIVIALIAGALMVYMRYREIELSSWFLGGLIVALVLAGIFAGWRSKHHVLDRAAAFLRLEADLGLHNALTAAAAGRASWPEPLSEEPSILRWNLGRVIAPLLCAAVFLFLAFSIPIAPAVGVPPTNEPYTWTSLETDIEQLVNDETIQEDYADSFKKRLEELRNQKASEWFSAASLEATDSLRQAHMNEIAELERDLMKAEQALKQLADPKATDQQREQMQKQFEEALEGMRGGLMKPNEDLLKKLKEAAEKGMEGMTPEQREELRKRLQKRAKELADAMGQPEPGMGEPEEGPGFGGDLFGEKSEDLKLKRFERLDPRDTDELDPGDLLKVEEIEHDLDQSTRSPRASGGVKSKGTGGDRVWKDALEPSEQKSLKHFFE